MKKRGLVLIMLVMAIFLVVNVATADIKMFKPWRTKHIGEFVTDSAVLTAPMKQVIGQVLAEFPAKGILVVHVRTDKPGTEEYNRELVRSRVIAIKTELERYKQAIKLAEDQIVFDAKIWTKDDPFNVRVCWFNIFVPENTHLTNDELKSLLSKEFKEELGKYSARIISIEKGLDNLWWWIFGVSVLVLITIILIILYRRNTKKELKLTNKKLNYLSLQTNETKRFADETKKLTEQAILTVANTSDKVSEVLEIAKTLQQEIEEVEYMGEIMLVPIKKEKNGTYTSPFTQVKTKDVDKPIALAPINGSRSHVHRETRAKFKLATEKQDVVGEFYRQQIAEFISKGIITKTKNGNN